MSLVTHLDNVVNKIMAKPEYEGNDRDSIRSLASDVLKIAQTYITKPSASGKNTVADGESSGGKRATTAYIFFGQCFNNPSDEKKALIDGALGRIFLSESSKYAVKTKTVVDALSDEQKETLFIEEGWESATETHAAIRKEGITGFSTNAFLWNNLSEDQKKAVVALQASGEMPTGKAPKTTTRAATASAAVTAKSTAASSAGAAKSSGSGKKKNGHNDIKTMISAALSLPSDNELRQKLAQLQENAEYAGKNALTLGVAIWNKLDDDSKTTWNTTCAELPSDKPAKLAEFTKDSSYFDLLQSTVEALLEA